MAQHLHILAPTAAALILTASMQFAAAEEVCKSNTRIVGGEKTEIKEHPWQVALNIERTDGSYLCGGAIVVDKWVVTAAHCFDDSTKASQVRVRAGITNRKFGGAAVQIERLITHPQYDAKTQINDLALIRLRLPPAGEPIPFADPGLRLRPCELLEVTGWGRTVEGGTLSDELRKAAVPYVETAICNAPTAYNGAIGSGMMCAGFDEGGVDACQGDSGGPLVYRGPDGPVLVGIVSWGHGCARRLKYGVYTRITAYRDWIAKTILEGDK